MNDYKNRMKEWLRDFVREELLEDEEWWTKMSADQQADYIRQHPQSQKAQDAKKEKEDDKSKSERPKTIHLDYDEAEDNINSLQYSGELSDYPGLTHNIGDMVNVLQSGHATDDDIQRAQDISNKIDDIDMTNPDAGLDDVGTALGMALKTASEKKSETGGDDKPKGKVSEKPGGASHIESTGGNNVLLAKGTREHIARHNKPGEGSVFSDKISIDDVQGAIGEIPEEFYEQGGGVHTTTVPNAGFNLVQKASDIEKNHPNAKKIKVKKQVGFDREKNEPIMKEVDAYIIDADKEEFSTDQLNVVVRPSNPDFMDDDLKNDSDVQQDLKGGKSHSVLTSFPGDPDVPPAQDWEESGHAIIIPNGGKDADKSNWVTESVEETKKRDYKAEYKKFQSSTKAKKYRAELNKYNRQKGTYGNGDGKDASHKGGKIVGFEAQSKNRGRAEKSRLKKEAVLTENPIVASTVMHMSKLELTNPKTGKKIKATTPLVKKKHPLHKKAKLLFSKLFKKKKASVSQNQSQSDIDFYKKQFTGESINEEMYFDPKSKFKKYIDKVFKQAGIKVIKYDRMKQSFHNGAWGGFYTVKSDNKVDMPGQGKVKRGSAVVPVYISRKGEIELGIRAGGFHIGKVGSSRVVKNLKDFKEGDLTEVMMENKEKIKKYLMSKGDNEKDATDKLRFYDLVKKLYKGASPAKRAEIMSSLWANESVNEDVYAIVDKFNQKKQDYDQVYFKDNNLNKVKKHMKKMGKKYGKMNLIRVKTNGKMSLVEAVSKSQAQEIMRQLGGRKFEMLMGVKSKGVGKDGLILHIGKNPKKVSHIIIDLSRDEYNLTFGKIVKYQFKVVKKLKGVGVEQLHDMIEKYTGLFTTFRARK